MLANRLRSGVHSRASSLLRRAPRRSRLVSPLLRAIRNHRPGFPGAGETGKRLPQGAAQEGIVRHERIMPDGRKHDSLRFSIIDDEWPAVKAALLARLGRG